jgi:hypothetical protein
MRLLKAAVVGVLLTSLLLYVYTALVPTRPVYGQSTFAPFQCTQPSAISTTANVQLVTASNTSMFIYICALSLGTGGTAETGSVVEGTGTTCGTGTKALYGGTTAATGAPIGTSPIQFGSGIGYIAKTVVPGDNVCLLVSSTSQVAGAIAVAQLNQ